MTKRTQSQIGKHSRRKGKAFENWCARYFTEWTGLKWSSTRNSGRTDLKGDIYCVSKPDLKLIVECKNRQAYSVHAMLKPTKAFTDMCERYALDYVGTNVTVPPTMLILKNETGVWVHSTFMRFVVGTGEKLIVNHLIWVKLNQIIKPFWIDGERFDGSRLGNISKES